MWETLNTAIFFNKTNILGLTKAAYFSIGRSSYWLFLSVSWQRLILFKNLLQLVHWFGFLVHHREGYKMTCFSLAPKFKNGIELSKLDPDEKTSATSQKNFQSLRYSHCTWSCWWDWLTEASFKKKGENWGRFTESIVLIT